MAVTGRRVGQGSSLVHSPARSLKLLCILFAASLLSADTHADVVDLFASMTAALTVDNAEGFMAAFDRDTPDYDKLKARIGALLDEAELAADLEFINDDGDEVRRSVNLDWYLEIRSKAAAGAVLRRRQVVHCDLRKEKNRWRIISISPLDFFAAAKFDAKTNQ